MQSLKKLLGQRIKEIRKQRKLKQYELAVKVNVDPKYISRIENGVSAPTLERIEMIAKALKVEPRELFDVGNFESRQMLITQINESLLQVDTRGLQLVYKYLLGLS